MAHQNLLGEPEPTLLPENAEVEAALSALADDQDAAPIAAAHPTSSRAWAVLADRAFADGQVVAAYAYARTGYHRGLDQLRRSGWKGHGPVPWSHKPNRGFLRAVAALARAAGEIGEADEAARCAQLLKDCDPAAADRIA